MRQDTPLGRRIFLCALFSIIFLPTALAQPVRLAILPGEGERAPAEVVVAQVEAGLTGEKEISLVERAEVRRILREQKISLSGLADPSTAAHVGKLLSVEMFLFIERIPKSSPAACRAQIIESRTGVSLAGIVAEEQSFGELEGESGRLVRLAVAKKQVPLDDRHYVAVLGVRNEEPGHALDGLASALELLLVTDLAEAPGVVALDREHLRWLNDERNVSDLQLELKKSAILLEAGFQRTPGNRQLAFTVLLRPVAGGQARRATFETPEAYGTAARLNLASTVLRELGEKAPVRTPLEPKAEAAVFLRRSVLLVSNGEHDSAVRAAEAAYALLPDDKTRLNAASAWGFLAREIERRQSTRGVTEAERNRALLAAIRQKALVLEQYKLNVARAERGERVEVFPQTADTARALPLWHGGLAIIPAPGLGEVFELQKEVADLEQQIFDLKIEYMEQHAGPDGLGTGYWDAWSIAAEKLGLGYTGNAEAKVAGIRKVVKAFVEVRARKDVPSIGSRLRMLTCLADNLQRFHWNRDAAQDERKIYADLFREYRKHPDPFVRAVAYQALICLDVDSVESAQSLLKLFNNELGPEHEYRKNRRDSDPFATMADWAFSGIQRHAPERLDDAAMGLFGPWMGPEGDGWRLVVWYATLSSWFDKMEARGDFNKADAVAQQVIQALGQCRQRWPNWDPKNVEQKIQAFQNRRNTYAGKLGRPFPEDPAWTGFTFRSLQLKNFNAAEILIYNDHIVCAAFEVPAHGRSFISFKVYALPEGGDPVASAQRTLLPSKPPSLHAKINTNIVRIGDTAYWGTMYGLAEYRIGAKDMRLITEEDGLPANLITAVAPHDGKLYMGFGAPYQEKSGFACYDPQTGESRLIASSSATERRSALEGGGSYCILGIVPDAKRGCFWLGLQSGGVCRYLPSNGKFEKLLTCHALVSLAPHGEDNLVYGDAAEGTVMVNRDTLARTWLAGSVPPEGYKGKPLFSGHMDVVQYLGQAEDFALSTGEAHRRTLMLLQKGRPPAPKHGITGVRFLERTRFGILVVCWNGQAYLVQEKATSPAGMLGQEEDLQ